MLKPISSFSYAPQIIVFIVLYISKFFLPSELRRLLGLRKIMSTSFVASMAHNRLSTFDYKQFGEAVIGYKKLVGSGVLAGAKKTE